ncbi:hypothetical protein L3C95_11600 [Chitinophaga filiformis]|uniref:hypothetical protein n=1 Tax=Chitinophaga filiformis TaxID=104663 RepID=UPI001F36030D|nr:hypothetical protein [Chitinophaga filiformis]MCF6402558.1 hypothetical protein [Chitinophaga filiformis]MCF6403524.1 hypothetical protein [Chitinophaga filiformis]
MKFLRNALLALMFASTFTACSKDDDNKPSSSSHKVVFKAIASAGCTLTAAAYAYDGHQTTATGLSGATWTSPEITVPPGTVLVTAAVVGSGVNASSSLKVQIFVDGDLKKEGISTGEILNTSATYSF